jgi:uncharacterized protein (TIGR02453 family)
MAKTTRAKSGTPAPPRPPFAGFPSDAFSFFKKLAKNNNREWFLAHKKLFERSCQAPLTALTVALDPPFGSDRLTRIYRDVRFSKDKSPYHTHISTRVGGHVLYLTAEGLYVGTGLYMPEPDDLRALRAAIDRDASGRALAGIVATLRKKGYTVTSHESIASAPRGFDASHPRIDLLRMKDIHVGRTLGPGEVSTAAAVARVRRVSEDIAPLGAWLARHVGKAGCG